MANLTPKQRSRLFIAQALYQWQLTGGELNDLADEFLAKKEGKIAKGFFLEVFNGISQNITKLDEIITSFNLEIAPVERAILYLGIYELKYSLTTPYKVVINECLNLAEAIGADGSFKVINATLDKLSLELRQFEK
jgi:N utilization substance protein B